MNFRDRSEFEKPSLNDCRMLAAMLVACLLLSTQDAFAVDPYSRLPQLAHAERDLVNSSAEAEQAIPDKKFPLNARGNFFMRNSIEVCTPDLKERQRRPDLPPIDLETWLDTHPQELQCIVDNMEKHSEQFKRAANESRAGGVSPETLKALGLQPVEPPPAVGNTVPSPTAGGANPWNGTGAQIEHAADGVFLSYTDASGAKHRYAVVRPNMLNGMASGDLGSWLYVTADKSSGRTFQVGAGGNVQSNPLSAMQIKLFLGQ